MRQAGCLICFTSWEHKLRWSVFGPIEIQVQFKWIWQFAAVRDSDRNRRVRPPFLHQTRRGGTHRSDSAVGGCRSRRQQFVEQRALKWMFHSYQKAPKEKERERDNIQAIFKREQSREKVGKREWSECLYSLNVGREEWCERRKGERNKCDEK